jgi:hypothetical protein
MRLLVALVLACSAALCIAAAPEPDATPSGPALPEIGRTRANTPACAAMRDLVIPAFAAAQRADARFVETRKALPRYAEIAADRDPRERTGIHREAGLARLGTDASRLLQEALTIKKALEDPRLAKSSTDPQVVTERAQLEQLYAVQRARADALNEFVMREHAALAPPPANNGTARRTSAPPVDEPPPITIPADSGPRGMPLLTGINPDEDKRRMDDWGTSISLVVRRSEAEAAVTFLPIAQGCR